MQPSRLHSARLRLRLRALSILFLSIRRFATTHRHRHIIASCTLYSYLTNKYCFFPNKVHLSSRARSGRGRLVGPSWYIHDGVAVH